MVTNRLDVWARPNVSSPPKLQWHFGNPSPRTPRGPDRSAPGRSKPGVAVAGGRGFGFVPGERAVAKPSRGPVPVAVDRTINSWRMVGMSMPPRAEEWIGSRAVSAISQLV